MNWLQRCAYYLAVSLIMVTAHAQSKLVVQDADKLIPIGKYVAYWADSTTQFTFDQVRLLPDSVFQRNTTNGINFGSTNAAYWFRFDVNNQINEGLFLLHKTNEARYVDLFLIDQNDSLTHRRAGVLRPLDGYYFKTANPVFKLGQHPKQIYLRLQTPSMFLPLFIGSAEPLGRLLHRQDLFHGLLLGIMLAMVLYNLFIFISTRDRAYLYYFLYALSGTYLIFRAKGLRHEFIWPDNPVLHYDINLSSTLVASTALLFTTHFLNTRQLAPWLHWWLIGLWSIGILLLPTELMPYQSWVNTIYHVLYIIFYLLLLATGIRVYWLGYRPARFYVLAWSFFNVGAIVIMLGFGGVLPMENFFVQNAYHIGSACETLLLAFALADRIRLYRQNLQEAQQLALTRAEENEQLLVRHNQVLEEKLRLEQQSTQPSPDFQQLMLQMQQGREKLRKLSVPTMEGPLLLPAQDIVRLEAMGSYCSIHLSNRKKIVASYPVSHFEPMLDTGDFFRIHKSHLINLRHVEQYIRGEGGSVVLSDGSQVNVSRRLKQAFLDTFSNR